MLVHCLYKRHTGNNFRFLSHIHPDGNVAVVFAGARFIDTQLGYQAMIGLLVRLSHPMIKDRSNAVGVLPQGFPYPGDRHFVFNKPHTIGLEQHRKSTAFTCPEDLDLPDLAVAINHTGNLAVDVADVLEKVQMTPLAFHGVMNGARLPGIRIRKVGSFFEANINA